MREWRPSRPGNSCARHTHLSREQRSGRSRPRRLLASGQGDGDRHVLGPGCIVDPAQATAYGNLVGTEAIDVGVHVIEGPGMDMARIPQGGRNFEYMGEDPFLAGSTAVPYIQAMQAHGIIGRPNTTWETIRKPTGNQ